MNVLNSSHKVDNSDWIETEKSSSEEIVSDKHEIVKTDFEKVIVKNKKGKSKLENQRLQKENFNKEKRKTMIARYKKNLKETKFFWKQKENPSCFVNNQKKVP